MSGDDRYAPTLASVREHYGEMTEGLGGPAIVPGNLAHFDRAVAIHDVEVATQTVETLRAAAGAELWAELERAAAVYESIPEYLRPVITVPRHRDEQHPRKADGRWMAHCNACGTYVDDWTEQPPADFLCDECQETGDEPDEESTAP